MPGFPAIDLVAYYPEFADYYPECELQTKRWFVENVMKDWVIFDAGANIGYYSILFSKLASNGAIYAFEPTETIELLQANLRYHDCTNVIVLNVALGNVSGPREDNIFRVWGQEPERRVYDFSTVDAMVDRLALTRVDCIKIDVDSFDFEVLRGAERTLRALNPWVVVELNHALSKRNQSVPEALEWLYGLGYRAAHVLDYENYVLRRSDSDGTPLGMQPSVLVSFETRPLIVLPQIEKADRLPDAFDSTPKAANAASVCSVGVPQQWNITVPGPRWSYAATWRRSPVCPVSAPVVIEVEVEVFGGTVGIGCVQGDFETYIGKEVEIRPAAGVQNVVIALSSTAEVGYLVLRNVDQGGTDSSVSIYATRTYRGVPSAGGLAPALLATAKRRISLSECRGALHGTEPSRCSASADEPGFDIVPVERLGSELGFNDAFVPEIRLYRHGLVDFKTEIDETAVFSYIYREFRPSRHFEFGTWQGHGVTVCARACDAEIWTINLPTGERDDAGTSRYASTDSGTCIGQLYREAGFSSRVHQMLSDSRQLDTTQFGCGFFDSALIDGGHSIEIVENDTRKAFELVRPGGLIIWHDFCPDVETLARNAAPRGVLTAIIKNYQTWRFAVSRWFWIRPSWLLIGIRR